MKKARSISLITILSIVFNILNGTLVLALDDSLLDGENNTSDNIILEDNEPSSDDEELVDDKIFIKSLNPGFTDIGEFFEIGAVFGNSDTSRGDLISLAGLSVVYMTSSGTNYIIYSFSDGQEMVGESLLFRLANSFEVTEAESPETVADIIYSRGASGVSRTGGRLKLIKNYEQETEEVIDSLCWGLEAAEGETCYKKFNSDKPTTLVRNESAEEMDELFLHLSEYSPTFDFLKPGLKTTIIETVEEIVEPKCRTLSFSEILTYYETSYEEQFIELVNSGDIPINLDGCFLGYKNKLYKLEGTVAAGGFFTIYPVVRYDFSLTKNPTNANLLTLIDTDGIKVDSLTYYSGQRRGVGYAQFGYNSDGSEQWLLTYSPTPGEENNFQKFKTCPVGKVINSETGNCINETVIDKTLEACPDGKYRNPLTNRCKAYTTTANAELKPCAEGYERNPATGRCRKVINNSGAEYSIETEQYEEKSKFIALGAVVGVVALGIFYTIFQYRTELVRVFRKQK